MANSRPVYVLGTGLSHDGSACLLRDGEICVAIEKERITRRKHDGMNDKLAIEYCLGAAGIRLDDVDLVVQNANFGMFKYGNESFRGRRVLPNDAPVVTISHHLAHGYGAFYTSPFDEAAIVVIDGCGNAYDECLDLSAQIPERPAPEVAHLYFEKDSFYHAGDDGVRPVMKDFSAWGFSHREYPLHPPTTQHSIGGLYLAASVYVFGGFDDAGKLMGLAPYGRPGQYAEPIFDLRDGRVFVRYDWMPRFVRPARSGEDLRQDFQYYADIAHWVQSEVERSILYVIQSRRDLARSDHLCYAGGVALNAVANRRIARESGYRHVFIQPAAGDNGLAVGCAYYGWRQVLGRERRKHSGTVYLGRCYSREQHDAATLECLEAGGVQAEKRDDYIEAAAQLLAEGKVVGWFQDGAELGPRALGNRSILADPRRIDNRERINRDIKCREDFRPFAPSVLDEDANVYFEWEGDSPYMLLVVPTRDEWRQRLAAVVHRDGSARVQTVTAVANSKFHQLLTAFKKRSGVGVLLNTSMNRRGMPIVETPADAVEFFASSRLDALVLGDIVVTKSHGQTPSREEAVLANAGVELLLRDRLAAARLDASERGILRLVVRRSTSWLLDAAAQTVVREHGGVESICDATIELDESDLRKLLTSAQGATRCVATGCLQIKGDTRIARRVIGLVSALAADLNR